MDVAAERVSMRIARGAGALVCVLGVAVLAGWALDVAVLKRVAPALASMKPNTALGLALLGAALALNRGGRVLGAAVAALGAATLAQDLFGWELGIDELLLRAEPGDSARMSPASAVCFTLGGAARALLALPGREAAAQWLALAVLAIALLATLGYGYGLRALYGIAPYSSMALHTALGFVVLAAGMLAAHAERGWMRGFASPGPGGVMLRRVFVPALGALVVLGWLRVLGEAYGLFEAGFGVALMVIATAILFSALAWRCARELDAAAQRQELMSNAVPTIVWTSDTGGRVTSVNERWQRITGTPAGRALGEGWLEFVHPDDRSRTLREVNQARASRSTFLIQHRLRGADGAWRTMVLAGLPWFDARGAFRGHVGSSTDVTPLEEARSLVGNLARRLLQAEESERRALSRELHDRVGQNLSAINLNLELVRGRLSHDSADRVAERIRAAQDLLMRTTRDVRDVMADLRPPGLEEDGLASALKHYAERFPARVAVSGADPRPRLPPDTEMGLFRISQEAITNAAKHASASRVEVLVEVDAAGARVTIADDGAGFEPAGDAGAGLGLATMRERAEAIGARLAIDAAPGRGTRVVVEVAR